MNLRKASLTPFPRDGKESFDWGGRDFQGKAMVVDWDIWWEMEAQLKGERATIGKQNNQPPK
jgi:hypothetical protein